MMETEVVSENDGFNSALTWLIAGVDFKAFIRRESYA
jgi:hypothetical protein